MSEDAGTGSARPRPLSGGFWTLLSWLRGDDHNSSSESISSAGSDRTAVSFAFLAPAHYPSGAAPIVLPPPGPPTDSYKKRVRDRNLRRQYDRDTTLHRKYGLFRGEGFSGYEAFSLPTSRRTAGSVGEYQNRERRATSECGQRRSAHVPGKRRAPPPPPPPGWPRGRPHSLGPGSINRRHSRKRPAPPPPNRTTEKPNESIYTFDHNSNNKTKQMSSPPSRNSQQISTNDAPMGCKFEKYTKKESSSREVKARSEKGFLKQIFDNRKRNSAVDVSGVKVLPSISELDKQAAEIIETAKIKKSEESCKEYFKVTAAQEVWYCLKCSNKYDKTTDTCFVCKTKNYFQVSLTPKENKNASTTYTQTDLKNSKVPSVSNNTMVEEKQKLKEMLKEMKDSLPKRPKHTKMETTFKPNEKNFITQKNSEMTSSETPTLRIGSVNNDANTSGLLSSELLPKTSTGLNKNILMNTSEGNSKQHCMITNNQPKLPRIGPNLMILTNNLTDKQSAVLQETDNLHTPLKISSLLNPIYIPKSSATHEQELVFKTSSSSQTDVKVRKPLDKVPTEPLYVKTADAVREIVLNSSVCSSTSSQSQIKKSDNNTTVIERRSNLQVNNNFNMAPSTEGSSVTGTSSSLTEKNNNIDKVSQHSKRRELVNQLEKSIASGDERAAADAAMKLAQLRLSCSVLSFSSQILAGPSTLSANVVPSQVNKDTHKFTENEEHLSQECNNHVKDRFANKEVKSNNTTQKSINLPSCPNTNDGNVNNNLKDPGSGVVSNWCTTTEVTAATTKVQKKELINAECINERKELNKSHNIQGSAGPSCYAKRTIIGDGAKKTSNELQKSMNCKVVDKNKDLSLSKELEKNVFTTDLNHTEVKAEVAADKQAVQNKKVTAQASTSRELKNENNDNIIIKIWVEDKVKARGPIDLQVTRDSTMGDLRRQAQQVLGLPARLQRWIVGRALCTDEETKLNAVAGPDFNAPFYLCLVEYDKDTKNPICALTNAGDIKNLPSIAQNSKAENSGKNVYSELVQLERQAIVPNAEAFECDICMENCNTGEGIVLRECVHSFCKQCLEDVIRHCEEAVVSCPAMGCPGLLHEREIRALVSPEDYERWLARGLAAAENGTRNAFHCRTRDCTGWAFCETGVRRFPCPVCKHTNCVPCQAIHEGETCERYQEKLREANVASTSSRSDEGTHALIQSLIKRGEALECPECKAIITKKWGCDWVKCSACKTEICWVTRGRRWGPEGRGDTSGGCKCGVDGKRCHPSCGYCH